MILLILIAVEGKGAKQKIFKFHCDSINMERLSQIKKSSLFYLNSTVILLICMRQKGPKMESAFKFHCDSINMEMKT